MMESQTSQSLKIVFRITSLIRQYNLLVVLAGLEWLLLPLEKYA